MIRGKVSIFLMAVFLIVPLITACGLYGRSSGKSGKVVEVGDGNQKPVAIATSDVTGGTAPLTVQFDGSGSYDSDNDLLIHLWDFGDGSATSTEVSPTHEYLNAGIYAARLTIQDPDGASDSQTVTIMVTEPGAESVAIDIKPGNWPNIINLAEEGVVTVAILTTPDFDAASVDTSIGENGEGKVYLSAALPKISGNSGKYSMFKDIDGDGDLDLVIQFYVELMDPDTFEIEGETTYALLTGQTWAGKAIWGRDQIAIVKE